MSFRIDPALPLDDEVRRIVREEATAAASVLSGTGGGRHRDLHSARKRLKKLRGLVRLVRAGDKAFHDSENARYRDIARSLAVARNAGALVEMADRFANEFGEEAHAGGLPAIRAALAARRERIVSEQKGVEEAVAAAAASLQEGTGALAGLALPHEPEAAAEVVRKGVKRTLSKAAGSLKTARKGGAAEDFHELRKAVKYHWMHVGLLREVWPGKPGKRRSRLKALGEALGEMNDIAVMRALLAGEGAALARPAEIGAFLELMARKEQALRDDCLAAAGRLFDEPPGRPAAEVGAAYARAAAGTKKQRKKNRRLVAKVGDLA